MPTITQDIVSGWIKAADGGLSNLELAQKAAEWGAEQRYSELVVIGMAPEVLGWDRMDCEILGHTPEQLAAAKLSGERTLRKLHDSTLLIALELQKEIKQLQTQLAAHGTKAADLAEPHCAKWPKCGCPHVYECIG